VPLEVLELLLSNSRLYTVILENYPSLLLRRSLSDKQLQDSTGEICNKSGVTMSMRLICYAFATYSYNTGFNESLSRIEFLYTLLMTYACRATLSSNTSNITTSFLWHI